ncbi:trihelix transcription factor GTL1-like isoform X1 [Musa acuminata AAA Group]|uniref:trihelix transcription factor GTL1-like isoform X1 n=2 Tax=Musa acuminata AAA Group TaxID=214697 RepID=UPI0031D606A6
MQQQGGSRYGVPPSEMTPFSPEPPASRAHLLGIPGPEPLQDPPLAEAPSPLRSRPPAANFDELAPGAAGGNFPEDDGEGGERGGSGATGNRWPRQETLALLQIRSDMDSAFRDATLKGPLWEEVSRKLAELGYKRSAKKCKEKFENVHKYYKRTKDGRAGRQDGKSYRFFSQLEALHGGSSGGGGGATGMAGPPASRALPISAVAPSTLTVPTRAVVPQPTPPLGPHGISSSAAVGISFSSNSSSSASSESDDEETEEAGESQEGRKRKRGGGDSGSSRKMMAFFDRLMKQVMERQEAMQQRFLDAIEKREQDRMIRDEAWRRQEMTRLNREQELLAQERAMAASRDTAIISYLQKLSGQTIPMPTMPATPVSHAPPPQSAAPPRKPQPPPPPPTTQQQQQQRPPASVQSPSKQHVVQSDHHITEMARHQSSSGTELVPNTEPQDAEDGANLEPMSSSSRWPKTEVHALINLRSGLDSKYHEAGPKGPLWEEISAGMQRLGYNRSAKRCKEKWENINKYFKKVKDSNKHRPDDSKTCPYFHQLDALYRNRLLGSGSNVGTQRQEGQEVNPASNQQQSGAPMNLSSTPPLHQPPAEAESKNEKNCSNNSGCDGNSEGGGGSNAIQAQTGNGGLPSSFFDEGLKKTVVIAKEPMGQQQAAFNDYDKLNEADSDNMDKEEEDDDDDDEDGKMQYKIQFQRQNVSAGSGGNTSTATAGSYLAIAQ